MFITVEGINGSGKSTMMPIFRKILEEETGKVVVETKEPGETPLGKVLRELILKEQQLPLVALHLFYADRVDHTERFIKPLLKQDAIVLCDRYYHSTFAFQGQEIPLEALLFDAKDFLTPDLTVFLRIDAESAQRRIKLRNAMPDAFERLEANSKAAEIYEMLLEKPTNQFAVLDASQTPEAIGEQFRADIKALLKNQRPQKLFLVGGVRSKTL